MIIKHSGTHDYSYSINSKKFKYCIVSKKSKIEGKRPILSRHLTHMAALRTFNLRYPLECRESVDIVPYSRKNDHNGFLIEGYLDINKYMIS